MICFEKTGIPVFSRFSINFATFVRNISAMQTLFFWIDSVNNVLWSYLLVALLLGCAVWFTVRTRGVQFRMLREMLRVLGESAGGGRRGERHVSSFQAFAVSLASRVGTGNLAGVATAIVYWVMFLTMVVYVCRHTYLRELMTWRVWEIPVWATLKKLAGIGFPGALAMLFEVTLFAAVALLIAPLGAIQVAGHQVALNFSSLLFMVPLSIGTAATIRTGFALGRKSVEAVRVASRSSWLLACMAACFTALVTILWRHQIAAVYNNDPVVLGLASHLLLFAATYQITDAVQVVSVGILRGYNDTRAILCVTLISYWVFALPVGYTLGRTHLWGDPLGPQGFWTAFIVGVSIAAVLLVIRVRVLERRLLSGFDRIRVMEG